MDIETIEAPVKAYTIKELKQLYGISYIIFHRWFEDEEEKIGVPKGRTYSPKQVIIIFSIFGTPKIAIKK